MCTHQPRHRINRRALSTPRAQTNLPDASSYRPPRVEPLGPLKALIRGATSKGVDATGGVDLDMPYPG
ncbi:hypothetical protein DV096_00305 [Bradymonadaceae bacterium TMQ3]|uniref:Uncharacterized protein n=1 Tax=Lujinxingia sediminis TaxID=2480984 RepID=A0ABY0CZ45_9DELT|nr:hypothetical protein [Lujinxingia sediminis]RDV39049.1 hypothetical protein DV096_00305 [Bradymonadaceae bacterium TMQ3]RVU48904.1 hypothetical protein EA187_05615 [Lujinxingia sediminis]TXC78198.1 hypothetical protein FRC91_05580 [Bradymonadales bacterium TMQ1]